MKDFKDKVAVITGAASGFGREFARIGADLGMKLALADVQRERLDETLAEIEQRGGQGFAMPVDVSKAEQVEALATATMKTFGGVHLVFNNAGIGGVGGLIWENSVREWEWLLGVNLWGVIHGVRSFTPLMLAAAKASPDYPGHIVNTASMAGLVNAPPSGAYNVSKHAVVSLTESLYQDLDLVTTQVRCSVLCPYFVPTGINQWDLNRPASLSGDAPPTRSQHAARAMMDKAVTSGKVSAEQVARMTFDAIRNDAFYIFSHPHALDAVRQRMDDILALRNPGDPFAARPELRARLKAMLQE
jgi:NAD(P)-dependent dehydrogenase (short-subunit alcohol dehydrogenase family)